MKRILQWGVTTLAVLGVGSPRAAWAIPPVEEMLRDSLRFQNEGKYIAAISLRQRACSILEKKERSSEQLATCLNDLALLYDTQGDYKKAEPLYERALTIWETTLGSEHLEFSTGLNNLAMLYREQGELGKAEPLSGWAGAPKKQLPDESKLEKAEKLKLQYEQLYGEGEYATAAPLAERACSILEKELGKRSKMFGACINDLAVVFYSLGEYRKAEPLFERALAILEKVLGPDHPDVALSLKNLAGLYAQLGNYGKAESALRRALLILERALGPDHLYVAHSLNDLAALYQKRGEYSESEALYKQALAIKEKMLGPEDPDVAISLGNLASLYETQGEYGKAKPLHERALAIREKALGPDHPDVALSLNNLAELYKTQGAYGEGESRHERALAIREKALGPDHPDVAASLNNLAHLYTTQGAYGKAEPLHERALAIWETAFGPDHPMVATSLNNLATLYDDQGAYEKAELLYKRALAIFEKALSPDHPMVATVLNNLALLDHKRGAYAEAEPLLKRALAIRERALGSEHPDVIRTLNNLASLYETQEAYGTAELLYKRVLANYGEALDADHPDVATSLNNLAGLYTTQGAYGKAEPLFERALAIREKVLSPDHPLSAQSLSNLATFYYDQGKVGRGLELDRRALHIEEANLVRTLTVADEVRRLAFASTLSGSLYYALSLHLRVVPEHDAIAELALTTLLRRKSRVQDLIAQSNAVLRRSLPDEERHLLDDLSDINFQIAVLSSSAPGKLTVEVFSQQLDDLRQQRERLWRELAKHSALVEALDHPVTIEDVQRTLSAGSVLIELIQYVPQHDDAGVRVRSHETNPPPHYAAYLVFPDRFDWVDLGPAAPIDEHIKTFRKALQTKRAIPTDLYDAVMRPIVAKLGSTHRLVIAPAGALSLVPFGAFYDGERYFVEKYELRYVTTGRDLLDPPASVAATTTPVTIVANPIGAFLPDAETEADFLESFFPDTHILRGKQATETNVRTVERPLILHMATHGFFGEAHNERDNPLFRSGLHLADIEQVQVDRERDDGQLTAYEVSGMDLRGTQLVVLSACDTGMGAEVVAEGKVVTSEGVSGLRRAFAMAGARTTVMSLWEVSGVTAQTTMQAYYRKLAEGQGPGEAMQAVQLEMLRTKEHAHPKDWAVFIVSGDDDPLDFPAGEEPRVVEEEPPQAEARGGCATRSSGRGAPTGSMLIGLLGLTALRRRD